MVLINCPECGNNVSTHAFFCPHCGYPMDVNKVKKIYKKPNGNWTNKWYAKKRKITPISALIFFGTIPFSICFLNLFFNYDYVFLLVLAILFMMSSFISLVNFRIAICSCKIQEKMYDGYTILVFNFYNAYLVIEDEIQVKSLTNRVLYGELPNKKTVEAKIAFLDGSITINVKENNVNTFNNYNNNI